MGANRRNNLGQSRRFAPCHILTLPSQQNENLLKYHNTALYLTLLAKYQETKINSQNGKIGNDEHLKSIEAIKTYLSNVDKFLKHN